MLGYFPRFYENELLYSAFARYHIHTGNISSKQTLIDLFNSGHARTYPHIPRNLEYTYNQCKYFNIPSLDKWIFNHTLYYYYLNFSRDETKVELYQLMYKGDGRKKSVPTNVTLNNNRYFKYCSKCVENDYERYGETYWRKDHQIYAVYYCLKHNELLQDSSVLWYPDYKDRDKNLFEAATIDNCPLDKELNININDKDKELLLNIAKQMIYVANNRMPITFNDISGIYRQVLHKEGYMKGKFINSKKLFSNFRKKYSNSLLSLLEADFDPNKRSNWLSSIVKKHNQVFSPLKHILLILLLNRNVETLHLSSKNLEYFYGSPYYCLNPFSDHYMQRVIDEIEIIYNRRIKGQVGLFRCNCGFSFTRNPHEEGDRIFQIKGVGKWVSFFEQIGNVNSFDFISLDRLIDLKQKYTNYKSARKRSTRKNQNISEYRERWFGLRRNYPNYSTEKLRSVSPGVYTYLYRYDKEWLQNNKSNIKNIGKRIVNWDDRDSLLLVEVENIYREIMEREKPIRVTIYSISRGLVKTNQLSKKNLSKLPKTSQYLGSILESVHQFQIRRLHYVFKVLLKEDRRITESSLKKTARIPWTCDQIVQNEINRILSTNSS
ncbi:TnsD family Tn7-like transposition protein [Metabacillus fastidiosus]|uniref:TnsD family Tn7-like transposition protein n=1 Tax=Metabacillus fastidiosus TaxID=1458 RepID=UPI002E1BBD34|nr:TnsD family Tn7-like transposition protein [Metabacillus fastidiosus]